MTEPRWSLEGGWWKCDSSDTIRIGLVGASVMRQGGCELLGSGLSAEARLGQGRIVSVGAVWTGTDSRPWCDTDSQMRADAEQAGKGKVVRSGTVRVGTDSQT